MPATATRPAPRSSARRRQSAVTRPAPSGGVNGADGAAAPSDLALRAPDAAPAPALPPVAPSVVASEPAPALPYGLTPAPRRVERASAPVDLGEYAEELRGWVVVFSRDVEFSVFRQLREMMQAAADASARAQAARAARAAGLEPSAAASGAEAEAMGILDSMTEWLERILLAWNFVDNVTGALLPQPRAGGAERCPLTAVFVIARAFSAAITPPKD